MCKLFHISSKIDPVYPIITTLYNGCAVPWGVCSTVGGFQYRGGYHEYRGGYLEYRGGVQYRGGIS